MSEKLKYGSEPEEICVLAGGLSSRMGRAKSTLRLGGRTMLGQIRFRVRSLGLPVRVIREDAVPRCGPLGGVFTALSTTRAPGVLFVACDMPFVSVGMLRKVLRHRTPGNLAVFFRTPEGVSFPFWLRRDALRTVREQLDRGAYSLQALAQELKATVIPSSAAERDQLFNVNTPDDWQLARGRWARRTQQT